MNVPNSAKMNADTTLETDETNKICAVCKIVAKQRCSACKITYYCSQEHQKSDWNSHSTKCRVAKLVEDPEIGRCYVAARKIENEEVLWEEKPLLIVPDNVTPPVCLNCYVPLNHYNAKSCDKCGWPLCKDCTVHGPECELTMKYRKSKMTIHEYSRVLPVYDAICVLRALALRDKSPNDYETLMKLKSHCKKMYQDWKIGLMDMSIYEKAMIVKKGMGIDDLDAEKIARIIGIVNVNGFAVPTPTNHFQVVIFPKSAIVSHDCVPNSTVQFSSDDNGPTITIRAIQQIEKGDRITKTFTNPYRATAHRRSVLRRTKFFSCTCDRCKDPTEFGTMFGAMKCFKEGCKGYMLPSTFLLFDGDTPPDYLCDKCHSRKSWAIVDYMTVAIGKDFSKIDQDNVNQLEQFIAEQANILHENNFLMFEANCKLSAAWAVMIQNNPKCATEEFLKKNIALCKKLIYLNERLMPSMGAEKGSFLMKLFEYTSSLHLCFHRGSPSENLDISQETREMLHEAWRLFRLEPKNSSMAAQAKCAQSLLQDVDSGIFFSKFSS